MGRCKKSLELGKIGYGKVSQHGSNVLSKKTSMYDRSSQRAASNGHKLRSKYYSYKAAKSERDSYDDVKAFYEGIKDMRLKSESIVNAAIAGKSAVDTILDSRRANKANEKRYREFGLSDENIRKIKRL